MSDSNQITRETSQQYYARRFNEFLTKNRKRTDYNQLLKRLNAQDLKWYTRTMIQGKYETLVWTPAASGFIMGVISRSTFEKWEEINRLWQLELGSILYNSDSEAYGRH